MLVRGASPAATGEPPALDSLRAVHAALETAFTRCESAPLRPALSRRVKTYIAAGDLGIADGYYGADQTLTMLRRAFAGRVTVRFSIDPARPSAPTDGHALLPARWVYRRPGAPATEIRFAFTLARDGPSWSIREIREKR